MGGRFTSLEIGAGTGGQALGLERAGFNPVVVIDNDPHACRTLRANRPHWNVLEMDFKDFVGADHGISTVDLLSGGVPSTPYSIAGKQEGTNDKRDLLAAAVYLAIELQPRTILLETTPSLLSPKFAQVRKEVEAELKHLGYCWEWNVLDAQHFGVPQTRRSCLLVAMHPDDFARFTWPPTTHQASATVGEALRDSMASRGWPFADAWAMLADRVAPTIVGGSKNHGGADLGPTRTKRQWMDLAVNAHSLGNDAPDDDFGFDPELGRDGVPKLTVDQVMKLQGLPDDWIVTGGKTARYKQVAQVFPPPLAEAVGHHIAAALAPCPR
ncbi:DNA cytosine methyltransferase [Planotetraspora phitsanulokensis]|uniref:DNA (cytosine-5-)-methyltransferase n=1 Tax=Planotetraspora phitsanulokensis TaxID=575192 RepID=A0A8J3U2I8_9ACTN|nr:DNA cytosine methyltransferase [Planotetraspora phitsanulokensis]GII37031.1 cytosine-specific methyltransferase [Planotetraspora phitsanulokensis]